MGGTGHITLVSIVGAYQYTINNIRLKSFKTINIKFWNAFLFINNTLMCSNQ